MNSRLSGLIIFFVLHTTLFAVDNQEVVLYNGELHRQVQAEYESWKQQHRISEEQEQKLLYTLTVSGLGFVGEYTVDAHSLRQIKEHFISMPDVKEDKWFIVHVDSQENSDLGIPAHPIFFNTVSLEKLHDLAKFIPSLKSDLTLFEEQSK